MPFELSGKQLLTGNSEGARLTPVSGKGSEKKDGESPECNTHRAMSLPTQWGSGAKTASRGVLLWVRARPLDQHRARSSAGGGGLYEHHHSSSTVGADPEELTRGCHLLHTSQLGSEFFLKGD